ncbi:MAG: hypothetical protein ACRD3M_09920 [Thermoanaerobaculia bacterium]
MSPILPLFRRVPAPLLTTASAGLLAAGLLFADEKPSRALSVAPGGPGGTVDLRLAPDLSFTDDSSGNFPIQGANLSDGKIASDRTTAIFFGTSHCWNTNREAERFVELYRRHAAEARFLVVDLEHPSADQRLLITRFFGGYIPHVTFLDRRGEAVYNRSGETARERGDVRGLEEMLRKADNRKS